MQHYTLPYDTNGGAALIWVPDKPKAAILFLHGIGERTSAGGIDLVRKHGPPKLYSAGVELPYMLIAPQCSGSGWYKAVVMNVLRLFDEQCKKYGITEKHCTGLSMGGRGTYDTCRFAYEFNGNKPGYFRTYGVMCGWGDAMIAYPEHYEGSNWKLWHGTDDTIVVYSKGVALNNNLNGKGIPSELVTLQGVKHDAWTYGYMLSREDNYFNFLEQHSTAEPVEIPPTPEEIIADLQAQVTSLTAELEPLKSKILQIQNIVK